MDSSCKPEFEEVNEADVLKEVFIASNPSYSKGRGESFAVSRSKFYRVGVGSAEVNHVTLVIDIAGLEAKMSKFVTLILCFSSLCPGIVV